MVQRMPMPPDHAWTAGEGNQLLVVDRGAVTLEVPRGWTVVVRDDGVLQATDVPAPDDDCRIEVSVLRWPLVTSKPLTLDVVLDLMRSRPAEDAWDPDETHIVRRGATELAWCERLVPDRRDGRLVVSRGIVGVAPTNQAVVTFGVFADLRRRFEDVWQTVLSSLQLARDLDLTGRDATRN